MATGAEWPACELRSKGRRARRVLPAHLELRWYWRGPFWATAPSLAPGGESEARGSVRRTQAGRPVVAGHRRAEVPADRARGEVRPFGDVEEALRVPVGVRPVGHPRGVARERVHARHDG